MVPENVHIQPPADIPGRSAKTIGGWRIGLYKGGRLRPQKIHEAKKWTTVEDTPLSVWLRYIPIPVLVLLALLPGIAFRAAWRGKLKDAELHVRWPWWRR
jgi:hypothetical protein